MAGISSAHNGSNGFDFQSRLLWWQLCLMAELVVVGGATAFLCFVLSTRQVYKGGHGVTKDLLAFNWETLYTARIDDIKLAISVTADKQTFT